MDHTSEPHIYVRADGEAYLDLRIILPHDKWPKINFGGRIIGQNGQTIKKLSRKNKCKLILNTPARSHEDPSYNPSRHPPHLRVKSSGKLSDVLRRMSKIVEDLEARFHPDWRDQGYSNENDNQKVEDASSDISKNLVEIDNNNCSTRSKSPSGSDRDRSRSLSRGSKKQENNQESSEHAAKTITEKVQKLTISTANNKSSGGKQLSSTKQNIRRFQKIKPYRKNTNTNYAKRN